MTDIYEANGARFYAEDDMIVRWCRKEGKPFEPVTTAWMFGVMESRAGAFVDVGASTGWFSVAMALRGREVHSFEPNPVVVERLRANAVLNKAAITIHQAAASRDAGFTAFFRNPRVRLTSGGSIQQATCNHPERIEVRTVALDEALAGVVPALIKIDVEGHEIGVLEGARGLLRAHRPHLMLEANTGAHKLALSQWLQNFCGYSWHDADDRNMLCTPERMMKRFLVFRGSEYGDQWVPPWSEFVGDSDDLGAIKGWVAEHDPASPIWVLDTKTETVHSHYFARVDANGPVYEWSEGPLRRSGWPKDATFPGKD